MNNRIRRSLLASESTLEIMIVWMTTPTISSKIFTIAYCLTKPAFCLNTPMRRRIADAVTIDVKRRPVYKFTLSPSVLLPYRCGSLTFPVSNTIIAPTYITNVIAPHIVRNQERRSSPVRSEKQKQQLSTRGIPIVD